jgi:hypothetical protein
LPVVSSSHVSSTKSNYCSGTIGNNFSSFKYLPQLTFSFHGRLLQAQGGMHEGCDGVWNNECTKIARRGSPNRRVSVHAIPFCETFRLDEDSTDCLSFLLLVFPFLGTRDESMQTTTGGHVQLNKKRCRWIYELIRRR